MKTLLKITSLFSIIALMFVSCKKEETQVVFSGGTAPVLAATASTTALVLLKNNENNVWNTLSWTNPNYQFNTGASSQDVTYTIQIDTLGANFKNPNMQEITISKDLSNAITVKVINTAIAKLELLENIPHTLEMRVKSTLANGTAALFSNVIRYTLTPYLDVAVVLPSDLPTPGSNNGDLFLVGSATSGGWNNPVPVPTQKFTRTSSTTYEITIPLAGGNEYLMLPKNGDWGNKYAVVSNTLPGLNAGGEFGANKSDNFPGPSVSGNYKIVVNFKTGKFTVTKL
jgi:starch-binding outer membrane protein SusE/F